MIDPAQAAALNRLEVQTAALTVKHQLTDLQRSQQPTLIARMVDALTRPNPIRITTAPYEGPLEMMAQAPNAHQLGHLEYDDGPPQHTVHPVPPHIQRVTLPPLSARTLLLRCKQ